MSLIITGKGLYICIKFLAEACASVGWSKPQPYKNNTLSLVYREEI